MLWVCRVTSPTVGDRPGAAGDCGSRAARSGIGDMIPDVPCRSKTPVPFPSVGLEWGHGPPDLRDRERVRHHLHVRRSATPDPRRGRPLPVPQGRVVGPVLQRLPLQRVAAVPRCRLAPRVRHPGVRPRAPARGPRQGGGADPRGPRRRRPGAARRGGGAGRDLRLQEQHRLRRQLLRLPRELPRRPGGGVPAALRRPHPLPREPADHLRGRQGRHHVQGRHVLRQPAGRPHLGGSLLSHDTLAPHHQHPRRAARRRRALPASPRHRRGLQHERDHDHAQGRLV